MRATLAVVGNPNVGKTAVFNALTGLSQTTGNYPGVTVDRKHGTVSLNGQSAELVDLPGSYSLAARSPDEVILADVLLGQHAREKPIDGIIAVVDASNLERNLYFVSQLLELEKPLLLVLNMMDIADRRGIVIHHAKLSELLGVPVLPICAHKNVGIDRLKEAIAKLAQAETPPAAAELAIPDKQAEAVQRLYDTLREREGDLGRAIPKVEVFRALVDEGGYTERRLLKALGADFADTLREFRALALDNGATLAAVEAKTRYGWVRGVMEAAVQRPAGRLATRSEHIDNILTHKVFGTLIFLGLMMVIFQAIYAWAGPLMGLIDGAMGAVGGWLEAALPPGMLQSLIVDGMVAGVGSVLIFLPQILMLSLIIAVLEDIGYMSRAAFLMDKLLSWCGLSGQSFIPMMSSFACAIPGIMATRTIQNRRDRFTTILVAPLMSCSARLPVYLIMIAAFVPADRAVLGFFNMQGLTLFLMYALGTTVAIPVAWILKKTFFRGKKPPFLLEMPSYKIPQVTAVLNKVYREGREFIQRAGTLIFSVAIIVWALAYFPHQTSIAEKYEAQRTAIVASTPQGETRQATLTQINHNESSEFLEQSYLGRAGKIIEPVFRPLGWDWRIATAVIASFPAREIIVATLGTLFNLGSEEEEGSRGLIETLQAATVADSASDASAERRPLFNLPVALSIMVFFALCMQCGATLVTMKRETGQWRWPALTFAYMTTLAYVGALITYQTTTYLGWGG